MNAAVGQVRNYCRQNAVREPRLTHSRTICVAPDPFRNSFVSTGASSSCNNNSTRHEELSRPYHRTQVEQLASTARPTARMQVDLVCTRIPDISSRWLVPQPVP